MNNKVNTTTTQEEKTISMDDMFDAMKNKLLDVIKKIATDILNKNPNLGEFYMGNGTYRFNNIEGENSYMDFSELDNFINKWNLNFTLTQHYMTIKNK